MNDITRFLLELGKGFLFVGRQMELRMLDGTSYYPDLIFYHYRIKSFVVCELKRTSFQPEHAGKLNFYVKAVDELLTNRHKARKSVIDLKFPCLMYLLQRYVNDTKQITI